MKKYLVLLLLLFAGQVEAGDRYWVSATGGITAGNCGAASGLFDPGFYFRTWADVKVCITGNDGDEVYFKDGNYGTIHETTAAISGSAGNPTVLRSVNQYGAVFSTILLSGVSQAHHITIQRVTVDGTGANQHCINWGENAPSNDSAIIVEDSELKNCFFNGILAQGDNNIMRRLIIRDVGDLGNPVQDHSLYITSNGNLIEDVELINSKNGYGVHLFGSGTATTTPSNNIVRGVRAHGTFLSGAFLTGITASTNNHFYNNIAYSIPGGFAFDVKGSSIKLHNNVVRNVLGGAPFRLTGTPDVRNNVVDIYTSGPFQVDSGTPMFATNFCTSAGTGCTLIGSGGTNPARFADAPNADFRLCTGAGAPHSSCVGTSALIGAGTDLSAFFSNDIAGSLRIAPWTIGAYGAGAGTPSPACPSTPALVASYGFDGDGTDASGNGNTATLGSGLAYTSGKYGSAVVFNGTAAVTAADSLSLFLCTGLTFSGSLYPTSAPSGLLGLMAHYDATSGPFVYASSTGYGVDGAPLFGYTQGGLTVTGNYSTLFTENVWTDFAFTYDSTLPNANLKLWINGVVATTANGTATIDRTTGLLYIGGTSFDEFLPSGWKMDEIRIYNHARTSTQINTDRNTPITAIVPGVDPQVLLRLPASASGLKLAASATAFKVSGGTPTTASVLLLEGGGTDCLLLEGGGTDCLALEQ